MRESARTIATLTAIVFLATPLRSSGADASFGKVPLFARFATDGTSLRSYVVPVSANVTVRKIISLHARLHGSMRYEQPNALSLSLNRVSPQQRKVFAKLATPRTWPEYYKLQLVRTSDVHGHKDYVIRGIPRNAADAVDHLVADISDGPTPRLNAKWFLRGRGTITMHIETAKIRGYVLPVRDQTDVNVPGYRIHADVEYGNYALRHKRFSLHSRRTGSG